MVEQMGRSVTLYVHCLPVAHPKFFSGVGFRQEFFRGGVQQIQLRTEGRENGDLGAVAA
jgi:hypothetical protein